MISPNLAGLAAVLLVAGLALAFGPRRRADDDKPKHPVIGYGVALFVGMLVATATAVVALRPQPVPNLSLTIADTPAAELNKAFSKSAYGPDQITVLFVREGDNHVGAHTTVRVADLPARLDVPDDVAGEYRITWDSSFLLIEKRTRDRWDFAGTVPLIRYDRTQDTEPAGVYSADLVVGETMTRHTNLLSLITPGARYRAVIVATADNVPTRTVEAATFFAKNPPRAHDSNTPGGETVYSRANSSQPLPSAWYDAFGPAVVIVFLGIPLLLTTRLRRRRTAFVAGVLVMLLLAVLAERVVAPALCAPHAYHRFFTATGDSTR